MTDKTVTAEREALLPCRGQRENSTRHGHARHSGESPTYKSWQSMLARCRYLGRHNAKSYASRGITVCDRWQTFENFLEDMGERPAGTTLDRKDGEKGYFSENCRWATPTEQARNRRNGRLTFDTAVAVALERLRGVSSRLIAQKFGCSESLPREIAKGRTWKDALAEAKRIGGYR